MYDDIKYTIIEGGDISVYQQSWGTDLLTALMNHWTVQWLFATTWNVAGVSKGLGPEQTMMRMHSARQRTMEIAVMHVHIVGHWCHLSPHLYNTNQVICVISFLISQKFM